MEKQIIAEAISVIDAFVVKYGKGIIDMNTIADNTCDAAYKLNYATDDDTLRNLINQVAEHYGISTRY